MKHLRSIDMSDGVRASAPGPASSSQARADTSRRILIVEDNAFVADQCESALAAAGYEVVAVVPTAEAAVEAASAQKPDLVLMDIYLAGPRDGVDAAVDIFEGRGIRSVFVSALFDRAIEDRARRAQPLGWLTKPFSDGKLVATVQSAITDMAARPGP